MRGKKGIIRTVVKEARMFVPESVSKSVRAELGYVRIHYPFECPSCQARFKTKGELVKHEAEKHHGLLRRDRHLR